MNQIWIVKASSGQYDDYWSWNVIAFSTEQAAQDYIAAQPQVDYEASRELQELQTKYCAVFYEQQDTDNFTDEQWDQYYDEEEKLNQKALAEVQARYPNADLSLNDDF
jgi:hypothetical protein